MNGSRIASWLALLFCAALVGCASAPPQPPIEYSAATGGRIGVAMKKLPAVDTSLPGAGCLLCLAAAAVANTSLTGYAKTLPYEQLPRLKDDVAQALRRKGGDVVVIEETIDAEQLPSTGSKALNVSPRNFSSYKTKYAIDRLLLIEIDQLGFERTYSAYVPTSDPKAVLRGRGYLVNLSNNAYEWYAPVSFVRSSDGKWDEPPKFPGLSNAYFQTLELGRDAFLEPFSK